MSGYYGDANPKLTKAVNALAKKTPEAVRFLMHAEDAMADDDFDHQDVLLCLQKGTACGPEVQNGELRANVIHRGIQIRVVIGGIQQAEEDWSTLRFCKVVTVMRQS